MDLGLNKESRKNEFIKNGFRSLQDWRISLAMAKVLEFESPHIIEFMDSNDVENNNKIIRQIINNRIKGIKTKEEGLSLWPDLSLSSSSLLVESESKIRVNLVKGSKKARISFDSQGRFLLEANEGIHLSKSSS